MSIYPVRLSEWFSPPSEQFDTCLWIIKQSRCYACGKKLRFKSAVGHHSIPWGNGEIWCSWKCCKSDEVAKADKRQCRTFNRRNKIKGSYIDLLQREQK